MLTDDELKRIAAEEHYRHSVRKAIEAQVPPPAPAVPEKHSFGKKLFDFFNSSVGMWLLSSVVLTGGAAMLQQIQHDHEIALKNREDLTSHRFEIQHRLDSMTFLLKRAKTIGDAKNALNGVFKSSIPLTPELQNRSLASLYLTIQPLLAGTAKDKTAEAFELVKQLEESELLLQAQPDDKPLDSGELAKLTKVITAIQKLHFTP
ncbi:MAG: hypothetical protein A3D94_18765 [Alphaproteobacteria bacterium RIFCSPHIGHO2_12_FULL_66_14]|jgi:hypothetical protein|nr:MAG: hypothetical protein A3D94_18765 [Alphaproteobacteria bacterium RIFCSPHIGHO2_12_FULL_66_14]